MISFVCQECKDRKHENCPGGTWCDCHHRSKSVPRLPSR